jgi:hypothetical protein
VLIALKLAVVAALVSGGRVPVEDGNTGRFDAPDVTVYVLLNVAVLQAVVVIQDCET